MEKKIKVKKVEIERLDLWIMVVGICLSLIVGIILLILADSPQDRIRLFGWMLIGYAGFKMACGIPYSKIKKKEKKPKKKYKLIEKLAKRIVLILVIIYIINCALFLLLLFSELSNLIVILIYFPTAIGLTSLGLTLFFIIFLHKNDYSLKKISKKFKKKSSKKNERRSKKWIKNTKN